MPRVKDIAWKFVIRLEGEKWCCPYCETEYSGKVTRVRSHFLKHPNKGIAPCKKVPEHISKLMDLLHNQVCNKEDIGWKFVDRLEDNKWRCHYCSEEFLGDLTGVKGHLLKIPNEGISICTEVPDHVRKLMLSLLDEVAEEERGEANGQSAMEPQSHHVPTQLSPSFSPESLQFLRPLLPTPRGATNMANFTQQDVIGSNSDQQSQAQRQFHQSSAMSLLVQSSHVQSALVPPQYPSVLHQSIIHETRDTQQNATMPPYNLDTTQQPDLHNSPPENLVESRDIIVNTPEEIQRNELHNPTVGSSLQNDLSLDVDSTNRLQGCSRPCVLEGVPGLSNISPTNTVQHPDQLHPRCDTEDGNDTCLFPSPTPVDIDPSIASQHTIDSNVIEVTTVDLRVATDTAGPSSSQDLNMGSPIMNVQSIYANDEDIRNLKRKVEELDDKEALVREQMETESAASSVWKKPRILVQRWLKETEKARNNFQIIGQANAETLPPKEQVETLTREVEELIEQALPQTQLMVRRDAKGVAFLEQKLTGEAIHRNIELIWDRLKENHPCKLGVCGMGGVGKTTIVMRIHNRLLKDETFDSVLFITVSQDFTIKKLQSDIWKALKLGVLEDEHEKKRAVMLSQQLETKKNCVLILDDVWRHFNLQNVGIPDKAGFKVVLTTRSSRVCSQMDCEEIKVEPLGEEEAWELFVGELGSKPLTNIQIEKVARKIAKRCAGLPLAINSMASSMRGANNVVAWQETLNNLERSHTEATDMEAEVLPVLTLSYERLQDPQDKKCFLFCALFPEDKSIHQVQLLEYFIDEGFLDEADTREEQYYKCLAIVYKLQSAFLLEVHNDCVRMHDLIREMALHIMSKTCMVKAGRGLQRIPNEEYWTEDLERVSLMHGYIKDIPLDMSPNCPKLSTLLLNNSLQLENRELRDPFFMKLQGLKVLNLSGCAIRELPDSLSELANLRALLLRWCRSLGRVPYLGNMKFLRKLDVSGCQSLSVVEGLEELRKLRYLDLSLTRMESLSEGILRRMVYLQFLKIEGTVKLEEVIRLKALERLECKFGNVDDFNKYVRIIERSGRHDYRLIVDPNKSSWFVSTYVYSEPEVLLENKIKDDGHFLKYPKSVQINSCNYAVTAVGRERNNDSILIPGDVESYERTNWPGMTNLSGVGLFRWLRALQIIEWNNSEVLFGGAGVGDEVHNTHDSPAPLFPSLETLEIGRCSKLKYLFGHESRFSFPLLREVLIYYCEGIEGMTTSVASPPQFEGPALPRLETISVVKCGNMTRVVESEWLPHFPKLRRFGVENCNKIKELLLPDCLLHLQNLEHIEVCGCALIEKIISGGKNHRGSAPLDTPSSSLPSPSSPLKLKRLLLKQLPKLVSVWQGPISFTEGASIEVHDCPALETDLSNVGESMPELDLSRMGHVREYLNNLLGF